jgi:hypothetical protein
MCAYDFVRDNSESCHFSVVDSDKCYLGTLSYESSVLDAISTSSAVDLKMSKYRIIFSFLLGAT